MSSAVVVCSSEFACGNFGMFRQLVLMVLFGRLHGRVGGGAIFNALGDAEVVLQDGAVAEMTVSVTLGDVFRYANPPVLRTFGICYVSYTLSDRCPRNDALRNVWRASFRSPGDAWPPPTR